MAGEHYASGNWRVKEGSEEEFMARWRAWLSASASAVRGFGSARLLRDTDDPRHFVSFSDWEDPGSRNDWKASPEFAKGIAACRELCEEFPGSDLSEVASV
jgi:heme-degrading monooxygenase HmoA